MLALVEDERVLNRALLASQVSVVLLTVPHPDLASPLRLDIAICAVGTRSIICNLKAANIGRRILGIGIKDITFSIVELIL